MSESLCPRCARKGRYLVESSKDAAVDYYRCDNCGHVWSRDRKNPKAPSRDVTVEPKKSQ